MAPRRRRASWPSTCVPHTDWEAEVHTTCALDAITWDDVLDPGDRRTSTASPCTGTRRRTAACPTSTASTGIVRLAPRLAHAGAGEAVGRLQRPGLARAGRRRVRLGRRRRRLLLRTSTTRRWRPSARSRCRRCSTRRRTTSRRSTSRCSAAPSGTRTPSASTRRPSAPSSSGCTRWRSARRSCSASVWATPRAPAGPAASCSGLGERPYIVSVGRVDEHKGSKMLASYFATYKERHPGPLALALVGPVSVRAARRTPTSS